MSSSSSDDDDIHKDGVVEDSADDILPLSLISASVLDDTKFENSSQYNELRRSSFVLGGDDDDIGDGNDDGTSPNIDADLFDVQNPTLFSETYSMTVSAAAIFSIAEVRQAARNGIIDAPEVIQLPVSAYAITEAFARNQDALRTKMKKHDYDLIEAMRKQMAKGDTASGRFISTLLREATLEYFGDEDVRSECVHLVLRNDHIKRILVCFRGSITLNDWIKDSKVVVGYINNPLLHQDREHQQEQELPETLGVHLGFREYLYDEKRNINLSLEPIKEKLGTMRQNVSQGLPKMFSSSSTMPSTPTGSTSMDNNNSMEPSCSSPSQINDPKIKAESSSLHDGDDTKDTKSKSDRNLQRSRIARILEEVKELRTRFPDHRIYCTGHSLGGALAQLTAIEVAVRWGTPTNPVTYIGVGNPRAATVSFRDAIQMLEKQGKMRCLGIHNHRDIVPMVPTSALHVHRKNTFCQVGFQMLLSQPGRFEMKYCPETNPWQELKEQTHGTAAAVFRPDKIAGRHHYMTYLSKLRALEVPLSKLHLNDYYNEIVKPDLFPGSETKVTPSHITTEDE